jgi:hypothetical protein
MHSRTHRIVLVGVPVSGAIHLVIDDEAADLAVLGLLNRSDASAHVAASAGPRQ